MPRRRGHQQVVPPIGRRPPSIQPEPDRRRTALLVVSIGVEHRGAGLHPLARACSGTSRSSPVLGHDRRGSSKASTPRVSRRSAMAATRSGIPGNHRTGTTPGDHGRRLVASDAVQERGENRQRCARVPLSSAGGGIGEQRPLARCRAWRGGRRARPSALGDVRARVPHPPGVLVADRLVCSPRGQRRRRVAFEAGPAVGAERLGHRQRGPGGSATSTTSPARAIASSDRPEKARRPDDGRTRTRSGIASDRGPAELDPRLRAAGMEVPQAHGLGPHSARNRRVSRIVEERASRVRVSRPVLGELADRLQHRKPGPPRRPVGDSSDLRTSASSRSSTAYVVAAVESAHRAGAFEVEPTGEHRTAIQHRPFVVVEQVVRPLPPRGAASGGAPDRAASRPAAGTGRRDGHAARRPSSTPSATPPARSPAGSRRVAGRSPPPRRRVRAARVEVGRQRPGPLDEQRRTPLSPHRSVRPATAPATAARRRPAGPRGWWRGSSSAPGAARIASTIRPPRRATCSQLSSTSSDRRPARASAMPAVIVTPALGTSPTVVATASGTASGSTTAASSTSHTPSGNSANTSAAACTASRVFPTPPTPVSVTRRRVGERFLDRRELGVTTDEGGVLRRQVRGERVERPQGREVTLEIHVQDLEDPLGLAEVLQAVLAEIEHLHRSCAPRAPVSRATPPPGPRARST